MRKAVKTSNGLKNLHFYARNKRNYKALYTICAAISIIETPARPNLKYHFTRHNSKDYFLFNNKRQGTKHVLSDGVRAVADRLLPWNEAISLRY